MGDGGRTAAVAWLVLVLFYFYQYMLRSAPAVMMPQLQEAFSVGAMGVAAIAGLFYWGYSPFNLIAGAGLDRLGTRRLVPASAFAAGLGALIFAVGGRDAASVGRFLQGAGGAFSGLGAIYIATTHFPASRAATLIGAMQMFGMAGGSAGQFLVGPMIARGLSWRSFWIAMAVIGAAMGAVLFAVLPTEKRAPPSGPWLRTTAGAFGVVFRNPQSILCGLIAGLLFVPTTIFDMVWGVRYLQEGHGFDYATAVLRSATVPLGWIIGCPLLGALSDRLGRRKPVIIGGALMLLACLAWILYGPSGVFPPYVLGLVAGLASGAAMLPYTVIKEANPPQLAGTASGVVGFLNFTFSALLGPVFGGMLERASSGAQRGLEHYQSTFAPMLWGVAIAIVLALVLKETGPRAAGAAAVTTSEVRQ
jgi:MFS family permease